MRLLYPPANLLFIYHGTIQYMHRPVWEALRQSACPMELRVDLGKTRESVRAQRGRVCERFAFLTKRKVEARTDGGVASLARVMTL